MDCNKKRHRYRSSNYSTTESTYKVLRSTDKSYSRKLLRSPVLNTSEANTSSSSSVQQVGRNHDKQQGRNSIVKIFRIFTDDSNQEDNLYKPGGYYDARIGECLKNGRYTIIRKLGWGHFSTVWLAWDSFRGKHVALKIVKSDSDYLENTMDEIEILKHVQKNHNQQQLGKDKIVQISDVFDIPSKNRQKTSRKLAEYHTCVAFKDIGISLLSGITDRSYKTNTRIPIANIKSVVRQILEGLDYLHKCDIIHTDIKPENILLCYDNNDLKEMVNEVNNWKRLGVFPISAITKAQAEKIGIDNNVDKPEQNGDQQDPQTINIYSRWKKPDPLYEVCNLKVQIADLGNACYTYKHFTNDVQTLEYRSIEAILRNKDYNTSIDLWSVGCVAFEMATGDMMFDPKTGPRNKWDENHVLRIMEYFGPIPDKLIKKATSNSVLNFFKELNAGKIQPKERTTSIANLLFREYDWDLNEAKNFERFLLPMFELDPAKRASADECLNHKWLRLR